MTCLDNTIALRMYATGARAQATNYRRESESSVGCRRRCHLVPKSCLLLASLCVLTLSQYGCEGPGGVKEYQPRTGPDDAYTKLKRLIEHAQPVRLGELPEQFCDAHGIEYVLIRPGKFMMGATKPFGVRREVSIDRPFYLGKYELTRRQWCSVMLPSAKDRVDSPEYPQVNITRKGAADFCRELSKTNGLSGRLPTEEEWEFCCKAGSGAKYCFGNGDAKLSEYAWTQDNSGRRLHPVGGKRPNRWMLYDMHGNAAEWCENGAEHGGDAVGSIGCGCERGIEDLILTPDESNPWTGFRVAVELPMSVAGRSN